MSWRPRGSERAELRERVASNVERFGTVAERAERVLAVLVERRAMRCVELATETGLPVGMVGGALGWLVERGKAERVGEHWTPA